MKRVQWVWRRLVNAPAVWLYASQLLARGYGFLATLVIARVCGAASVGGYSALLITCSSPTAPMAVALANSSTLMAAEHGQAEGMGRILRANWPALLASGALALLGGGALLHLSGLNRIEGVPIGLQWFLIVGLISGLLLSPVAMGMAHGLGLSTKAAKWVCGTQCVGLLAIYPAVMWGGLTAALLVTMLITMGPIGVLALRTGHARPHAAYSEWGSLRQEAWMRMKQALPNVLSTVLNNATNWLACIYLANRFHGRAGVALVAISLQWLALVQLPVSSYSGRLMYELAAAHQRGGAELRASAMRAVLLCVGVTVLMTLVVLAAAPWIASWYRVDRDMFVRLVLFGGIAASLSGFTVVYERVFFCLQSQRPWLLFSTLAYLFQLAVTFASIQQTLVAVPLGNAVGVAVLAFTVHLYLKRIVFNQQEVA